MAQVHHVLSVRDFSAAIKRWSLSGVLDWREWDGEFVVRHDDSGATCLLSPLAGETLKALSAGSAQVDEIARRIFGGVGPSNPATAALVASFADADSDVQILLHTLRELQGLGLVRASLT